MEQNPIVETWDYLAGQRVEVVKDFYKRLFERYPEYRQHFPENIDHQMDKMVEAISAVARFSDQIALIRPFLLKVGKAHKTYNLTSTELYNFSEVFIETLADACSEIWDEHHTRAYRDAFDDVVIPIMEESLGIS